MLSTTETLRDTSLDNTDAAIQKNAQKINSKLAPLEIRVLKTIHAIDSTLFVLSPNAMPYQETVKRLLKNHHRYSFEYARVDTNEMIRADDGTPLARIPERRTTLAVRRTAFKKLPRPIMCSVLLQAFLFAALMTLSFLIYRIALL